MANSKISALTSATTPLAGTEVLPVVQSSATTQVTVANLTAGRAVSGLSFAAATLGAPSSTTLSIQANGTTYATVLGAGTNNGFIGVGITTPQSKLNVEDGYLAVGISSNTSQTNILLNGYGYRIGTTLYGNVSIRSIYNNANNSGSLEFYTALNGTNTALAMSLDRSGNETLSLGNLIVGTAAKGINFTANTPAAGMTSQLLNWYEEGTWTPNQGAGLTLVGAFSSTGKYTRIGRNVTVSGTVTGATSVALAAAGVITSNLPFTVGTAGHGNATNVALTASAAVICTSTSVTSAGAIAATATITFSATYFV